MKKDALKPQQPAAPYRGAVVLSCLLVLATVAAYWPAMNGAFLWDDDQHVTINQNLAGWQGLARIWADPSATQQYYPLTQTAFWIEYQAWGLEPFGYHLVNVLLHAGSALLLWLLFKRLGAPWPFGVAVVFALHPVCVESAAWISELKNTLSLFLYLLAALALWRFVSDRSRRRWLFYAAGAVLFVGALLSKTVTATLPAAMMLLVWWKHCLRANSATTKGSAEHCLPANSATRRSLLLADILPLAPLLIVGAGMAALTAHFEAGKVGASGPEWSLSFVERLLVAGRIACFYAAKLLLPVGQAFIYPRWTVDAHVWWQYLFPAAVFAAVVALVALRRRIGKAPAVAVLFFLGSLLPALGFFNVYPMRYSYVADHFQYIACIGLLALAVGGLAKLLDRVKVFPARWAALPCLAVILGMLTSLRAQTYTDQIALWRATLQTNPNAWLAWRNLGLILQTQAEPDQPQALECLTRAAEIHPDAENYYNRGRAYLALGRIGEGIADFTEALRLNSQMAEAFNNRGLAFTMRGEFAPAVADFDRALALQPRYAEALNNRGFARHCTRQYELALGDYQLALEIKPEYPEACYNRGITYQALNRPELAVADYTRAIALRGDYAQAYYNRGVAFQAMGQPTKALADFSAAIRCKPDYGKAYLARAILYSLTGQIPQAAADAQLAQQLGQPLPPELVRMLNQ